MAERPELVADEAERHRTESGDRLSIELRHVEARDEHLQDTEVDAQRHSVDDQETRYLRAEPLRMCSERPVPVPPEAVAHGHDKGHDGSESVVDSDTVEEDRIGGEVDQVTRCTDDREPRELMPVRRV